MNSLTVLLQSDQSFMQIPMGPVGGPRAGEQSSRHFARSSGSLFTAAPPNSRTRPTFSNSGENSSAPRPAHAARIISLEIEKVGPHRSERPIFLPPARLNSIIPRGRRRNLSKRARRPAAPTAESFGHGSAAGSWRALARRAY